MSEGVWIQPTKVKLETLAKTAIEPELPKEAIVRVGAAFKVVTDVARDSEADLIIITTRGHTSAEARLHRQYRRARRAASPVSGTRRPEMRTRVCVDWLNFAVLLSEEKCSRYFAIKNSWIRSAPLLPRKRKPSAKSGRANSIGGVRFPRLREL
jgi:hypothetical protein